MVTSDFMGPLDESLKGNKYVLVFCCKFTKYVEIYPTPEKKAETFAANLLHFTCNYGIRDGTSTWSS